jgi:hypothetical protein
MHINAVDNSIHCKNVDPKSHLTRISPVAPGKFVITSRIGHPTLDKYVTPYANENPYRRMCNDEMKEPYVCESVSGMVGSILSILANLLYVDCFCLKCVFSGCTTLQMLFTKKFFAMYQHELNFNCILLVTLYWY